MVWPSGESSRGAVIGETSAGVAGGPRPGARAGGNAGRVFWGGQGGGGRGGRPVAGRRIDENRVPIFRRVQRQAGARHESQVFANDAPPDRLKQLIVN